MLPRVVAVLTALVCSSLATAVNSSGIFTPDGSVYESPTPTLVAGKRGLWSNSGERLTNALRFRSGLNPLPPRLTRTSSALRARASPMVCATVSNAGKIAVTRVSTGLLLGYISKEFDGQNSYTYGAEVNALKVRLPNGLSEGVVFEMTATNGPDTAYPIVGSVGGSAGYNFKPNQIGYTYLSGTGHTPAGSPPSTSAGHSIQSLGYNAPAESTIWSINCATFAITGQWVNSDSTQSLASVFYDGAVDFLGLVGDFAKFESTFPGEGAFLVTLKYVPDA